MRLAKRNEPSLKVGNYLTKNQKLSLLTLLNNQESITFMFNTCQSMLYNEKYSKKIRQSLEIFYHLLLDENISSFVRKIKTNNKLSPIDQNFLFKLDHLFHALKILEKNLKDFNKTVDYASLPSSSNQTPLPINNIEQLRKEIKKCTKELSTLNKGWMEKVKTTKENRQILEKALEASSINNQLANNDLAIVNMINVAILIDSNPQISSSKMQSIKLAMGADLFDFLVDRYGIITGQNKDDLHNQTFDHNDLRMIIIGSLQHCRTDWWENRFVKNLLLCLEYNNLSDQNYHSSVEKLTKKFEGCQTRKEKALLAAQLVEKLKIPEQQLNKLKETPTEGIINSALAYFREKVSPKWQFLIPVNVKYNNKFATDINAISAISDAHKWQNKKTTTCDSQDFTAPAGLMQLFASNEFLFHKLSSVDCRDGSVIPVIEKNGNKEFYIVKHLINNSSLNSCFALLPLNPKESPEIKVVFKPKDNLALEIIDTENFIQQQEFEKNKEVLLNSLNETISEFKHTISEKDTNKMSLNIGGYGSGGALAQCLTTEIIFNKTKVALHKHADHDNSNKEHVPKNLTHLLTKHIDEQSEHELRLGRKIKNLDKHKRLLQQKLFDELMNDKDSSDAWVNSKKDLLAINKFKLSTVNSAGISRKTRNQFIQSLYLLKEEGSQDPTKQFSITCDKIMSAGDPVQITGGTDLAAYVPRALMPTTLMHFDNTEDNYKSYKRYLLEMVKSASLIAIQYAVNKTSLLPGWVTSLGTGLLFHLSEEPADLLADNCKALLSKAKHAHDKFHLDRENSGFSIMSNHPETALDIHVIEEQQMNKLLTNKIPVFSSKPYQTIKKNMYQFFCSLKDKYRARKKPVDYDFERGDNQPQVFMKTNHNTNQQQLLSPKPQPTSSEIAKLTELLRIQNN